VTTPNIDDILDSIASLADTPDDEDGPYDPVLVFAGEDLPDYREKLPADNDLITKHGEVGDVKFFEYHPRMWHFDEGAFVLADGDLDYDDYDYIPEFEVTIEPDDYVAYRLVAPMLHGDEDLSFTLEFSVGDELELDMPFRHSRFSRHELKDPDHTGEFVPDIDEDYEAFVEYVAERNRLVDGASPYHLTGVIVSGIEDIGYNSESQKFALTYACEPYLPGSEERLWPRDVLTAYPDYPIELENSDVDSVYDLARAVLAKDIEAYYERNNLYDSNDDLILVDPQ
jgi:hypothetical protein